MRVSVCVHLCVHAHMGICMCVHMGMHAWVCVCLGVCVCVLVCDNKSKMARGRSKDGHMEEIMKCFSSISFRSELWEPLPAKH